MRSSFIYLDCEVLTILKLDEKKVRKGKPLGLPYIGSKKKISKKIVEIIKQNFGTDKPIYDIFGGGGAITAECLLQGLNVHYNDLDHTITDMFQRVLSTDREHIKTLIVSRDEFFKIKEKEHKTVDDELKLLINSFGNNRKSYLYAKSFADDKYNLAKEIIDKHDVFGGYRQTETYKQARRWFDEREEPKKQRLQQLGRLERLQQLGQLGRLERLQQLEVTNLDYIDFSDVEGAIFYLDPPYENATSYVYKGTKFDSLAFYDWAYEMSKKNIVLISSYEVSDSRFEVVYEFPSVRSTMQSGMKGDRHEKLFMARR